MLKSTFLWISTILFLFSASGIWLWNRFGSSYNKIYPEKAQEFPLAKPLEMASTACDLTVRRYRQIGPEMQFELAANVGGLAPYDVKITQSGKTQQFSKIPHRNGLWLTIPNLELQPGQAEITVTSLGQPGCAAKASFTYDGAEKSRILAQARWIRQGSKDNWLDIRPVFTNGRIFLKDFANYNDGRTRVTMIDGIEVKGLENGIEVKPGYLYSVTARWIDAPYNDWWNEARKRSLRQQNIWIDGPPEKQTSQSLTRIEIPHWFSPSKKIAVDFDTRFPEFSPIEGKIVAQYPLNADVSADHYFKRGISYLNTAADQVPMSKRHWTATPNFFADRDAKWFASLPKADVEAMAGIPGFGVYAYDFEFWNQHYVPEVKQRLIWFSQRIRRDHPKIYLMDYWGGGAYTNPHINNSGSAKPLDFTRDYVQPKSNNSNFDPLPSGESFHAIFNATPVDVYPKPMFAMDEQGNTPNNFVLLSAIHSLRINKLIPYQKNNKLLFYGWNRYMPLYKDPIVPWHIETTDPKGELILNQLEMMPASQALSLSLFSLVLFDGYYLWHDSAPYSSNPNAYSFSADAPGWGREWHPADNKTPISAFSRKTHPHGAPPYWDYPTEFYALGNWMAKQVEDVIVAGKNQDLPFEIDGQWQEPRLEQVLLAADRKEPFITSVIKGNQIVVLGIDSFQSPTAIKKVKVRLPDGSIANVELYGNWPSLYRGVLKK